MENNSSFNLYYLGIARLVPTAIVISSYSSISAHEKDIIEVLNHGNLQIQPGRHYSFSSSSSDWHLMADDAGVVYIMLTKIAYPLRVSHACLEELQRNFISKHGSRALTAQAHQIRDEKLFSTIFQKYEQVEKVDKIALVQKKIDEVKVVMDENIKIALENCVKLEKLEKDTEELMQNAGVFRRNAKKLRDAMWWKDIKMKLIFFAIAITILGVIIGVSVAVSRQN